MLYERDSKKFRVDVGKKTTKRFPQQQEGPAG
jgi:hypothetical protein